jgi:hypothetical protein
MLNGAKRIRAPLTPVYVHPINDYRHLLRECGNDYLARIPVIENKINVVEKNLHAVPFLEGGLICMKNELTDVKKRVNQINNVLENNRLNAPIE